jgi:glyoxylase-like metal-dependent hydrolase (beta-lactamase superfamily II)
MTVNLAPPPFRVGDLAIQRVMEMQIPFRLPGEMFPSALPGDLAELTPQFTPWAIDPDSGRAILAVQSYLVRTTRHTILIDTCIGCDKTNTRIPDWANRTDLGWLERLAGTGVGPEQIDYVFCTHLHADHSGWNTQMLDGRWVPTFPNAKYILARAEVEHAQSAGLPQYAENVLPVIEAGQAVLVDSDHALDDRIWLEPTPGHTPGHVAVHLETGPKSGGDHAVMWGDLLHSPLQCLRPDWWFVIDTDRAQGIASRRRVLENCCANNHLVLTAHFPAPSVGRITERGAGFEFGYERLEG